MQINCPSCSAVYDIPDQLVKRGPRALRCAACGRTWSLGADPAAAPGPAQAGPSTPPDEAEALVRAALATALETAEREMLASGAPEATTGAAEAVAPVAEDPKAATDIPQGDQPAAQAARHGAAGKAAGMMAALMTGPSEHPTKGLLIAWLATLGGLGCLILAFLLWPRGIVALWPAAARIYEAVGMSVGAS